MQEIDRGDESVIFRLDIGNSVEFDWAWEGASAFSPANINEFLADVGGAFAESDSACSLWSGEIVEVDEIGGCIYVVGTEPSAPPQVGVFFVKPFDFLENLHAIYTDPGHRDLQTHLSKRLGDLVLAFYCVLVCEFHVRAVRLKQSKSL